MINITNETIIKAAKAAALKISVDAFGWLRNTTDMHPSMNMLSANVFNPQYSDTDNTMIMDGADICLAWHIDAVSASFYIDEHGMHSEPQPTGKGKSQARREAVILCAAAKWDTMNGGAE